MSNQNTLHQDFIKAQKEFEPARKSSTNPHFRSKYADLSECIDAVKEALNNNNFYLKQVNHDCENGIGIETILVHVSGETISSGILRLPASKQDAQGYGSAMTYARRYSLLAVCGIAPEDDDGHSAKPSINKPILQQKIDNAKDSQAKAKSKEELILEGEKVSSMGIKSLETWWKGNLSSEDRELLKNKLEDFKKKAQQVDELNQDINQ